MPLYSFACEACTNTKDLLVRSWNSCPKVITCTRCSENMVRDMASEKPNFQLKGGGWAAQSYGMSNRECIAESDKECLATEKARKRDDKLKG